MMTNDQLEQYRKDLFKEHKHLVEGSFRRAKETGKITVKIICKARGCQAERRVATSDLFQVKFCEDCTKRRRAERRRQARRAARKGNKLEPAGV